MQRRTKVNSGTGISGRRRESAGDLQTIWNKGNGDLAAKKAKELEGGIWWEK